MNIPNPLDKGAPPAPDYAGASAQATRQSRPNQITPWASSMWSSGTPGGGAFSGGFLDQLRNGTPGGAGGGDGRDTQTVALSGPLNDANQSLMSQFASANANPLDNGAAARQHAEDAIYGRETSRLDPMWAQREHDFQTQMANQGIDPNSAAFATAMGNFGRGRNDAYSTALQDAIMGGGQEASRQQQMDLMSRAAPLMGMQGLQGLMQMPQFQTGGNPLQAAVAQGQYGLEGQQMNNQFWNDMMSNFMDFAKQKKWF